MRVIVRKERPHPGAQLRFTDIDGHRFTAFATSSKDGQLADLEPCHRRRAWCEDRIRCAKDTGQRNLHLQGFAQNQVWCEIVALVCDLLTWTQSRLTGPNPRWELDRLQLRISSPALGALVRGSRLLRILLAAAGPGPGEITAAITRLQALAVRLTSQNPSLRSRKEQPRGPVEPRPPGATAGQPGAIHHRKSTSAQHLRCGRTVSRKIEASGGLLK